MMKQKNPAASPTSTSMHSFRLQPIEKNYSEELLRALGLVMIAYNETEAVLDMLLVRALDLSARYAADVTSRINGVEGKVHILRGYVNVYPGLPPRFAPLYEDMLEGFLEAKSLRDAAAHARFRDPISGIAQSSTRQGRGSIVLLTEESLDALAQRLLLLRSEFANASCVLDALMQISATGRNAAFLYDNPEDIARAGIDTALVLNKERHALPALPGLPKLGDAT